jgi:hypothetical protein
MLFLVEPTAVRSVDYNGSLLVKPSRLIVPAGAQWLQRCLDSTGMVATEEQLTTGGLEYNADICLCSATIAPVQCVECAVRNCCCHIGLLSRSVYLYNQHS